MRLLFFLLARALLLYINEIFRAPCKIFIPLNSSYCIGLILSLFYACILAQIMYPEIERCSKHGAKKA